MGVPAMVVRRAAHGQGAGPTMRTRRTGLDAADRQIFPEILQLPPNDSELDPNEIQKLFPAQVLPELQRLLTLLQQKFQKEWREDISIDQLHGDATSNMNERDVKSVLAKDTMEMMLKSMYLRDQLSEHVRMRKQIGSEILTFVGVKKGDEVQI
ncbi:hypothetical protein OROMI_017186 [Orobanche minor]